MRKHHPRGCCGNPGICLSRAQSQKVFEGLPRATHCTDRAQTSGNVTPTVRLCSPHPTFRTKVRTRRYVPQDNFFLTILRIQIQYYAPVTIGERSLTHFQHLFFSSLTPSNLSPCRVRGAERVGPLTDRPHTKISISRPQPH